MLSAAAVLSKPQSPQLEPELTRAPSPPILRSSGHSQTQGAGQDLCGHLSATSASEASASSVLLGCLTPCLMQNRPSELPKAPLTFGWVLSEFPKICSFQLPRDSYLSFQEAAFRATKPVALDLLMSPQASLICCVNEMWVFAISGSYPLSKDAPLAILDRATAARGRMTTQLSNL